MMTATHTATLRNAPQYTLRLSNSNVGAVRECDDESAAVEFWRESPTRDAPARIIAVDAADVTLVLGVRDGGYVCCSVLQCVAVCCSVLQCVVLCCSELQCVAVCCSVLQCVTECCSVLQCVVLVRRAWIYIFMYIYIYIRTYIFIYMYIYIYIHMRSGSYKHIQPFQHPVSINQCLSNQCLSIHI